MSGLHRKLARRFACRGCGFNLCRWPSITIREFISGSRRGSSSRREACPERSKLAMYSHAEDVYGTSIRIESRIADVLVVSRTPKGPSVLEAVEHIKGTLGGRSNAPIANEAIDPTHAQVLRVSIRDPAEILGHTRHVASPGPCSAFGQRSNRQRAVRRRVGIYLVLPSAYMPRANTPMFLVRYCWPKAPMPTL